MADKIYVEEIQDAEGNIKAVKDREARELIQSWIDTGYAGKGNGGSGSTEEKVVLVVYSSYSFAHDSVTSTINGVTYTSNSFYSGGCYFLIAQVPKNKEFSYSFFENSALNVTDTLTLSDNYVLYTYGNRP